jgi:hypothetical protein
MLTASTNVHWIGNEIITILIDRLAQSRFFDKHFVMVDDRTCRSHFRFNKMLLHVALYRTLIKINLGLILTTTAAEAERRK